MSLGGARRGAPMRDFAMQTCDAMHGACDRSKRPRAASMETATACCERSIRKELRQARAQWFERAARDAGVRFATAADRAFTPDEGIVAAAQKRNCDLIVIGSHGRRGLARVAFGSIAANVIARSSVPVLVYR